MAAESFNHSVETRRSDCASTFIVTSRYVGDNGRWRFLATRYRPPGRSFLGGARSRRLGLLGSAVNFRLEVALRPQRQDPGKSDQRDR